MALNMINMHAAPAMISRCAQRRTAKALRSQLTAFVLVVAVSFSAFHSSAIPVIAQTKLKITVSIVAQSQTDTPFNQVLNLLKQAMEKQAAGQTDEAISLAERALKLAEKNLGPEHPTVVMSLATLAQLYEQKHDDKQAEQSYLRAIAIADK